MFVQVGIDIDDAAAHGKIARLAHVVAVLEIGAGEEFGDVVHRDGLAGAERKALILHPFRGNQFLAHRLRVGDYDSCCRKHCRRLAAHKQPVAVGVVPVCMLPVGGGEEEDLLVAAVLLLLLKQYLQVMVEEGGLFHVARKHKKLQIAVRLGAPFQKNCRRTAAQSLQPDARISLPKHPDRVVTLLFASG